MATCRQPPPSPLRTRQRLRSTAEANIDAVGKILGLVGEIGPVFGEVSRSVQMQIETAAEIGRSASETARFVDEVALRARAMSSGMGRAAELGSAVAVATDLMNGSVTDMTRQLVTVLRQNPEADRRHHDRWPVEMRGEQYARRSDRTEEIRPRVVDGDAFYDEAVAKDLGDVIDDRRFVSGDGRDGEKVEEEPFCLREVHRKRGSAGRLDRRTG